MCMDLTDISTSKKGRGRTKGLELAKVRGSGERIKLGFSRATRKPTSESTNDLTRYTTELGVVVRKFAPLQALKWEKVPDHAKERLIEHIRVSTIYCTVLVFT